VGDLAGIPAILALFGALFQLLRDSIAYDRSARMEEAKNRFTIGATSHMASIAFDKHVSFCEEYTQAVNDALQTLFRRGPHESVLEDANKLSGARAKWNVWLTPEIEAELVKFESALRTIGANAWLLGELRADEDRTDPIKEAYGTFAAVMGWETWRGVTVTRDLAAEKIIDGLRSVLGIGELTRLRTALVKHAMESLGEPLGRRSADTRL
jgi:hypothetical protein